MRPADCFHLEKRWQQQHCICAWFANILCTNLLTGDKRRTSDTLDHNLLLNRVLFNVKEKKTRITNFKWTRKDNSVARPSTAIYYLLLEKFRFFNYLVNDLLFFTVAIKLCVWKDERFQDYHINVENSISISIYFKYCMIVVH